jgi:hypothetical protein
MLVGVVGHRSWIARQLIKTLDATSHYKAMPIVKADAAVRDTTGYQAIVIIPGKLVQTDEERAAEVKLVGDLAYSRNTCKRLILLSSKSVREAEYFTLSTENVSEYARHKLNVEKEFRAMADYRRGVQPEMRSIIVRPGAIFGRGQDPLSPMLIPQLAREGEYTQIRSPDRVTSFVSVCALSKFLCQLVDKDIWNIAGAGEPYSRIPGEFEATPEAIKELVIGFDEMRSNPCGR